MGILGSNCNSECEVIAGHFKRCIRPRDHKEESHVWIEALNRSEGAPRIVIWTDAPVTKIVAYMIIEDLFKDADRNARAYGWEVGHGQPLTEQINGLSDDNPFLDDNWKDKVVS